MPILKFCEATKLSKEVPAGAIVGLAGALFEVVEGCWPAGSKMLSIAQKWAIACAASSVVNPFGELGAVVPAKSQMSAAYIMDHQISSKPR